MTNPVVFSGPTEGVLFRDSLSLNRKANIIAIDVDPTSISVNAKTGSLGINFSTGKTYKKLDDGDTTNWIEIELSAIQALGDITSEPTGFPNRTDSTYSIDNGTRTFTIQPVGASFKYYIKGVEYEVTAPDSVVWDTDEGPRKSTLEAMAKLRPAFKVDGKSTAGNSSQTSDGAALELLMTRAKAEAYGFEPLAELVSYQVAGVHPDEMGIGPTAAIPKVLEAAGLELKDIGLVELNEAFASQALYSIRTLGLDTSITNVNGGAIALGHPLGCTGAKLTATLLHEMRRRDVEYGLVSMCIGGGMGAAAIFER